MLFVGRVRGLYRNLDISLVDVGFVLFLWALFR